MSYLKGLADKVNSIEAKQNFKLLEIDIDKLITSNKNFFGIREIEELAASIKESGLMHNLVVRKIDDGYEILSGERRYRALMSLGYKKIPCQVRSINDLDAEILLIQANIEHRELNHKEKMESVNRLKAIYDKKRANGEELPKGKTRDLIGADMGLSGVQVGRYQKVSKKLIEPLKDKLDEGSITLTQADTLSGLKKEEQASIHTQIKDMDVKNSKIEVDILVDGIRQPVENKYDKDLLLEEENKEISIEELNDCFSVFNKLIKENNNPKIVISNKQCQCILTTLRVRMHIREPGYIEATMTDKTSVIEVEIKRMNRVDKINIKHNGQWLKPKKAYEINDGVYLWVKA